jgi:hypothetical protein
MDRWDEEWALFLSAAADLAAPDMTGEHSGDPMRLADLLRAPLTDILALRDQVARDHPEIPDTVRTNIVVGAVRLASHLHRGFGNNENRFGPQSWFGHSLKAVLGAQGGR